MNLAEARRRARNTRPSRVRSDDYFAFEGCLNQVDTPLKIRPGELIGVKNYEPGIRGGYRRVEGFERFDGRTKPSDADYLRAPIDNTTPANYPAVGDVVTGGTSGATGVLLVDVTAQPAVILGRVTGTFVDGETLSANALNFGDVDGAPLQNSAQSDADAATFRQAAIADARAQIGVVPGAGPIRGVARLKGVSYAFRDNVGQTECVMHVQSASGWTTVVLNEALGFDGGTGNEPAEGDIVVGGTSAATATIERIVITNGSTWSGGEGYFVLSGVSGTFIDNESLAVSAVGVATADGSNAAPTLAAGGRYEFREFNFYGHTRTTRLYGVDGVNKAFEYDDAGIFTQITTGMTVDKPNHLAVHQNQLWMTFPGGSVQSSGDGAPLSWQVVLGAGEIGVGSDATGMLEEVGDVLFVTTDTRTYTISGRSGSYVLDDYNFETGVQEWTLQRIGQGVYLDERGLSTLPSSDQFGNFKYSSFSNKVEKLINQLRSIGATASVISRSKNLYRLFFSDGRFVSVGFRGDRVTGITECNYGKTVRCIDSSKDTDGNESILFGSDDGYVYEADRGTSFDGGVIEAFARLAFHFSKSPTRRKRYRLAAVDISTTTETSLRAAISYTFGSPDEPGNPSVDIGVDGGGGFWDIDNWDEFKWNTGVVATARFKLEGSGRNIGLHFFHSSAVEGSHSLEGVTMHYSPRRLDRSTTG